MGTEEEEEETGRKAKGIEKREREGREKRGKEEK